MTRKFFLVIITLFVIASFSVNAQKVGFCDIEKIIEIMPEYESAKARLEGEVMDIQNQAEEMQVEFNNKYKQYIDNVALKEGEAGKWSPAILQVKEKELSQLQQRIQEFQYEAETILMERQYELLLPITTKVDSVIDVLMIEKGYFYVIKDLTVIQVNKTKCDDIAPFVKQKLGLQ